MFSLNKFVFIALTAFSGVAATAQTAEPHRLGQVLPVVSAHGHAPALDAVHATGKRHHHRRHHRAHPIRHVR